MKHSDYPFFKSFASGAFLANSGGTCTDDMPMEGKAEEYERAEIELTEICFGDLQMCRRLGMLADQGFSMCLPMEGNNVKDDEEPLRQCDAWRLLNRYY